MNIISRVLAWILVVIVLILVLFSFFTKETITFPPDATPVVKADSIPLYPCVGEKCP